MRDITLACMSVPCGQEGRRVGKATGILELLRQQRYAFAREAYRATITRGIEASLQAAEWRVVFAAGGLIASHSNTEDNVDTKALAGLVGLSEEVTNRIATSLDDRGILGYRQLGRGQVCISLPADRGLREGGHARIQPPGPLTGWGYWGR